MRKALGIVVLGLCSLLFLAGQTPLVSAANLPDSTIVSDLQSKLAGHGAAFGGVNVSSKKGVVTINGAVKSEELKTMATDLAKKIDGVTDVDNQLVVK